MLWKNKEGKFHRHAGKDGNYMYIMIHTNVIILYDIIYATCRGNVGREREEGGREDRQRKRERKRGREGKRERCTPLIMSLPPFSMSDSHRGAAWTLASECYRWSLLSPSSYLWLRPQWPPSLLIWCPWLPCCLHHHHCPPLHSPVLHHHSGHLAQACNRRRHVKMQGLIRGWGVDLDTVASHPLH